MSAIKTRPWIILALIFLLGAMTGSLLTIAFGPRPEPPGPQQMGNHWMARLVDRLKLTNDQQTKIRPIILEAEKQIASAHRDDVTKIGRIMKDTDSKIAEQLQPEQQAALKQLESDRERMFFRHMHGMRGPGDSHRPDDGDRSAPPPPEPPPVEPPRNS